MGQLHFLRDLKQTRKRDRDDLINVMYPMDPLYSFRDLKQTYCNAVFNCTETVSKINVSDFDSIGEREAVDTCARNEGTVAENDPLPDLLESSIKAGIALLEKDNLSSMNFET